MSNKSSKPVELLAHTVASCRDEITFTFSPALSFSNQESDYVSRPLLLLLQRYQLRKCPYTVDEDQEGSVEAAANFAAATIGTSLQRCYFKAMMLNLQRGFYFERICGACVKC